MFVNLKAHKHKHANTNTNTHARLSLYSMIQSFGHLNPYIKITPCHKIDIIIVIITIIVLNLPYA